MIRTRPLLPLGFSALLAACLLFGPFHQPAVEAGSHNDKKAQGAALFADKGCAHCHGPSGFGGSDTGPDLSRVRKQLTTNQIAKQIHDGGKNMPPFSDALSGDEIAALVDYLHSKRKPPPGYTPAAVHTAAAPPTASSEPQ